MTEFAPLSELAGRAHARAGEYRHLPIRDAAAHLAFADSPELAELAARGDPGISALVNVSALALSAGDRIPRYVLRPSAVQLIHETDLRSVPTEAPALLRSPWIAEVRRPERGECLWRWDHPADVVGLGGYPLGDHLFFVGLSYPDGVGAARWKPRWSGEDIDASVETDWTAMIGAETGRGAHAEWTRRAIRFALVLGLLLEASEAPLEIATAPRGRKHRKRGGKKRERGVERHLATRHVYLDEHAVSRPPPEPVDERGEGARPEGRTDAVVTVRGHLKRQRYGPGRSKVKWLYVAGYQARRWVKTGVATTVVHRRRGE